jgi:hypothetical protein
VEILDDSYKAVSGHTFVNNESFTNNMKYSKLTPGLTASTFVPCAITYNISAGDVHQYSMIGMEQEQPSPFYGYISPDSLPPMKTSSEVWGSKQFLQPSAKQESTKNSRKSSTVASIEENKTINSKPAVLSNKIGLLRKVLEGIHDETQILISAKPKNKSQKIRKSNRHSRYRGVSLNGKKWQVMIMGQIKKKYFGGIATEREAAVFYDKLSILTNGLAAKTNFNYRKSDLMKIMAELEYMESIIS